MIRTYLPPVFVFTAGTLRVIWQDDGSGKSSWTARPASGTAFITHRDGVARSPCIETLTVFPGMGKRNFLRLRFSADDNATRGAAALRIGYPGRGTVWLPSPDELTTVCFPLNRPRLVAAIIRRLRASGWNPNSVSGPKVIEDGLRFLEEHREALQEMMAPNGDYAPSVSA